jgi:hypothetical protein
VDTFPNFKREDLTIKTWVMKKKVKVMEKMMEWEDLLSTILMKTLSRQFRH